MREYIRVGIKFINSLLNGDMGCVVDGFFVSKFVFFMFERVDLVVEYVKSVSDVVDKGIESYDVRQMLVWLDVSVRY